MERPHARQLVDRDGVDPASLGDCEVVVARKPIVPDARRGLLEDAEDLEAATLGKGSELGPSCFQTESGLAVWPCGFRYFRIGRSIR